MIAPFMYDVLAFFIFIILPDALSGFPQEFRLSFL